jgi:hypothetical protein
VPIPERNYQRDPFVPVYHRSEESKRLEEEVKRKDIEKKLKLKKTQHYRQIREEKSKTKNRMISLGLPTIKARRVTYTTSQKKEVAKFVQYAIKMKWTLTKMRDMIQETTGFEKVSYQMAQRWHGEYILNQ